MVIFPLAPDQTIAQMWSNGARGGQDLIEVGAELSIKTQTLDLD